MDETDDMLGIGLIGTGEFGRYLTEQLAGLPGYRLAAVARGRRPAVADQLAERYGADPVEGLDGLLEHPGVHAVLIATPPADHAAQALATIASGRHVFGEKPLATTIADADAIVAAGRARGVVVTVNHVMRWNPIFALLRRLRGDGRDPSGESRDLLGELAHYGLRNLASTQGLGPDHWFWNELSSGGLFIEHGVHFFDSYRDLAGGSPETVTGLRFSTPNGRGPNDVALASVLGPGGASGTFLHSFTKLPATPHCDLSLDWEHARAELTGWLPTTMDLTINTDAAGEAAIRELHATATAVFEVDGYEPTKGEELRLEAVRSAHGEREIRLRADLGEAEDVYRSSVRAAMTDFIGAIRDRREPLVTGEQARLCVGVAVEATESAGTVQD